MNYGAIAYGKKVFGRRRGAGPGRQPFASEPVDVVNAIMLTEELDVGMVLAEWIAYDPSIAVYSDLTEGQAVKLIVDWSDRNGAIALEQGDHFTFVVPDIFAYEYIIDVDNVPITTELGELIATYSIYDNSSGMKEVRITFTDYVENHTDVEGIFWMLLYVGNVDTAEQKTMEFIINDTLAARGEVTVNPSAGVAVPKDDKAGSSSPEASAGGRYIFKWTVSLNMSENDVNGFNTLEGFSFEDIIPANSPHVFLTNDLRQELGLSPADYVTQIGEYAGADSAPPGNRYQVFSDQFNAGGAGNWHASIQWHALTSGLTTAGIGGAEGLHVTDVEIADKLFAAKLGAVTRPTVLTFYTLSTIPLAKSALGDTEVVGLFLNTFSGSYGEEMVSPLTLYRFEDGSTPQGITGEYGLSFAKVSGSGAALPGAMFSLFSSEDFSAGANRFAFSQEDGAVAFLSLPEGTYFIREAEPPFGYLPNDTVYKAVLTASGYEIYYGANFEHRLSVQGNRIDNGREVPLVSATPQARKNLTGHSLESGMFSFVIKDSAGETAATGTNKADGSIQFSPLGFTEPGIYAYTVEEIAGADSRITYDSSRFAMTVAVTNNGGDTLAAAITYPGGDIVFNNRYAAPLKEPFPCRRPCRLPCRCGTGADPVCRPRTMPIPRATAPLRPGVPGGRRIR